MTATPHVLTPIVDRPEQRVWIASALAAVLLALPISQLPVPPVGVTELLLGLCLAASVAASERWASTTVRIGEQTHNLTLGEVPLVVGLVIVSPGVLLLARITGRSDDMLIIRGVNVYPSQIEAELMQIDGLSAHYQLHKGTDGPMATLTVMVEAIDPAADRAALAALARERIKMMIGVTATVEVVEPFAVPRSQGKAQRVV